MIPMNGLPTEAPPLGHPPDTHLDPATGGLHIAGRAAGLPVNIQLHLPGRGVMGGHDVVPTLRKVPRRQAVAVHPVVGGVADAVGLHVALDDVVGPGAGPVETQDGRMTLRLVSWQPQPRLPWCRSRR